MSLVLNGGVNGTGTTQYAHVDARIVGALPCVMSAWFKNGSNTSAEGVVGGWVDADAANGTYRMGSGLSRSTGPVFTRNIVSRVATATSSTVTTRSAVDQNISGISTGATTGITVDNSAAFSAGEYVRVAGTLTGITGLVSGREYRIGSISSGVLNLEIASTGTWAEGLSATAKWSAWQPEKWNLMVLVFTSADPRLIHFGGFFGQSSLSIASSLGGTSTQYPADIFSVLDRISLGAIFQSGTATSTMRGELAHVAVWSGVNPSESQAAELLTVAPNLVSWGAPAAYWPLTADASDSIGSNDLTLVGTPTVNADAPSITLSGGGGGGSGYIAQAMRSRNPSIFGVR